mmetsp:Transcript_36101/g.93075  ORF Transcript_36101/g.93075 Transcript_36101/m.93075 type:complete len:143 (+) Transcript_36101:87-515(+)
MAAVKGTIVKCEKLMSSDWFGKSDPYVVVTVLSATGDAKGEMKTSVKNNCNDPSWDDEPFSFSGVDQDCALRFFVCDSDFGKDDLLGEAVLPVKLIPVDDPEIPGPDTVFTLALGLKKGKSMGTITVNLGLVPPTRWFEGGI